jgi:thiamine-monophosphate kinase
LVDGLAALAGRHAVSVVGGNITRTDGPLVVDVTAGGEVAPRRWLTRKGAIAGHEIYVSGAIGGAAAGLEMLQAGTGDREPGTGKALADPGSPNPAPDCIARHRRPEARVRLGMAMGRARAARAAMDLSDGLADALRQVAAELLPIDPCAEAWWTSRGIDPVIAALKGGDDYELLFAVPAKGRGPMRSVRRHVSDPPLTKIGVFTKDPSELVVERAGNVDSLPEGFEHFANR